MILTIDNLDGNGAVDYTANLCPHEGTQKPLTLERSLNQPTRASGTLLLGGNPGDRFPGAAALPVPARRGRVVLTAASGTILFTGYLATEAVPVYAGTGLAGSIYRYAFSALSDEWLLDKQSFTLTADGFSATAGTLLSTLTTRTAAGVLSTAGVAPGNPVGVFTPEPAQPWSSNAASLAASSYGAYRALAGVLTLAPVGTTTHTLDFDTGSATTGGTLQITALRTAQARELANDVTVSGQMEPSAYVTELFTGDGTTALFTLSDAPFHLPKPLLLTDSFTQAAIDPQLWSVADPGSHITLGANGLTLAGGTGSDGQTTLTALDALELGGSLLLEAASVQLIGPSDGVLCGLYAGAVGRSGCFAGWNVRQSGGNTLLTPFVDGAEVGTSYTMLAGHVYTLRLRLHSPEMQRVLQTYYTRVDGTIAAFGGGFAASPLALVFDLIDLGNASNTPATVLYDGSVASSPASCTFAPVDSVELTGSVGSITVAQTGSAWVVSTLPGGATQTRLLGTTGEGVDARITSAGKLTFFTGRIPVAGETIAVHYRTRSRAIARLASTAGIAAEAATGFPGTARWLGKVLRPLARCSADCEAAAEAILSFAGSRSAATAGSYIGQNPTADIWPGDVLALTANGQTMNVVVRQVAIEDGNAAPEVLTYRVAFANDWAEALGLTLSEAIAPDAYLPAAALPAPGQSLANLQQLAVVSLSSTVLQIDAGTVPPTGGGFEVRRRDWDFGPGSNANLVLRSPVRSFAIPRAAQVERFYIRMYDASTPPLYSRLSSAVFTDLPVGS